MRLTSGWSARYPIAVLGFAAIAVNPHTNVKALTRGEPSWQSADCPDQAAFASASVRTFTVNARPDSVWSTIRTALQRWHRDSFHVASRGGGPPPAVSLIEDEERRAASTQQRRITAVSGGTCFIQRRVRRRDYRIAFTFDVRSVAAKTPLSEVRVRWLGSYKGSSERTWRPDVREAIDHYEALRQVITASLRPPTRGS